MTSPLPHGPISWMAGHSVAANLLMLVFLIGGLLFMGQIKQEVFPEFEPDTVSISVAFPGASPEEVENGLLLAIEDALSGVDGINEIRATAKESLGTVIVEALSGADIQKLTQDIQKEVDRITTFPVDAEEPKITAVSRKRQVVSLVLYGKAEENVLHGLAEQVRDQLLQDPGITQVTLEGIRPLEISITVSQENLRRYRLSLAEIAQRIQNASVDLPGGSVKTGGGEILIRMKERKDYGRQFANIPVINSANGSIVLLSDIARIDDSYADTGYSASYNGLPAVMVQVYSVGEQTPIQVSQAVKSRLQQIRVALPDSIKAEVRLDTSEQYADRIDLLIGNGIQGLVLVFVFLALFLELHLAFWVMMGIPTTFFGAFLLLPFFGVSLNMVSLFAFILALDIVVDDAIVIGENIYHYRQQGMPSLQAAIKGAREMATPVSFSIMANIAALVPLFFMPGEVGKIFFMLPIVTIIVFLVSLVDSMFILPNHLAHIKTDGETGLRAWLHKQQQRFSGVFTHWVQHRYGGFLEGLLRHRYLTIVTAFAVLLTTLAYAFSGRMGMSAFPRTEADFSRVTLTMPYGTPVAKTQAIVQKILADAQQTAAHIEQGDQLIKGLFAEIGGASGSDKAVIRAYLAAPEIREKIISTEQFNQLWRTAVGELVGIESLRFESDAGGPGGGSSLSIELDHADIHILEQASKALADALRAYPIVSDVDDGFSPGKQQLDFSLLPEGKSLGLTPANVARQVRNAFYGAEVLRQQRGRNEIKVMVRLPENERLAASHIDELMVWTPTGKEMPLREAVQVRHGRAYTAIDRHNGHRNVQVTANVNPKSKAGEIINDLKATELPRLIRQYPGLQYSFEGQEAAVAESMGSLKLSFLFAVMAIYALLAIPLRDYILPLLVIVAIPFGIIGAIFGHLLLGLDLSIVSLLGIVALSGVVVNDSMVLIDHARKLQADSPQQTPAETIKIAATERFRPILLTTLTTFAGLTPMILETSRQARFLIPMAISIGFGVLFATLITLVFIPSLYLVADDFRQWRRGPDEA